MENTVFYLFGDFCEKVFKSSIFLVVRIPYHARNIDLVVEQIHFAFYSRSSTNSNSALEEYCPCGKGDCSKNIWLNMSYSRSDGKNLVILLMSKLLQTV